MMERKADRVLSISLSIIVHLAIIGALVWGWFTYRAPAPTPQETCCSNREPLPLAAVLGMHADKLQLTAS